MEALYAHTYLLLAGKLAAGGLLALAVPPFTEMERGFYRSSAAVFLFAAFLMAGGEAYLYAKYSDLQVVSAAGLALWTIFALLFSAYFATLYVEYPFLRARLFPASVVCGFAALAVTAAGYVPENRSLLATLPYVATIVAGAAVTGAAMTGMLLGHWYLIDTGLDLEPFRGMYRFCLACLRLEIAAVLLAVALLWWWPGNPWRDGFELVTGERFRLLAVGRVAAWGLALVIMQLITRTLAIPQTMAATGLFYIQALVVAVGQICGHWLLFRTGLPL